MIKLLVIISSVLLLGCNNLNSGKSNTNSNERVVNCINLVFEQDSIFGGIRNHDSEEISMSDAIDNYSKNIRALDFSMCPENFKTSFDDHLNAWLKFKNISNKYPLLRGEMHDIFSIIEKSADSTEFRSRLDLILETWETVKEDSKL